MGLKGWYMPPPFPYLPQEAFGHPGGHGPMQAFGPARHAETHPGPGG